MEPEWVSMSWRTIFTAQTVLVIQQDENSTVCTVSKFYDRNASVRSTNGVSVKALNQILSVSCASMLSCAKPIMNW